MNISHALPAPPLTRWPGKILHVTSPAPREVWHDILKADADALVSQTPAWLDSICALGGYQDASRLYEMPGGRQLVLPMVRRKGLPALLTSEESMPHGWGFGGLIGPGDIRVEEITAIMTDLAHRSILCTQIRPNPLHAERWAAAQPAGAMAIPRLVHALDLRGGFDRVWTDRFNSLTRRNIRKAERSGLVVECDTSGKLVPVFYDLFQKSVERWAGQQHEPLFLARWRNQQRDPLHKFQLMAQRLGQACNIWVAWLDKQPVATIMVLQGANAHYTRGAMDKELAGPTRANDLLHKLAIEAACQAGCPYYHMGESGSAENSLAQFKSRFGATAYPYAEYRLERLPLTKLDKRLRGVVKRLIGFKDV